jgi:hypothetical protein
MKIAGLEIKVERTAYSVFAVLALIPFFVIVVYTAIFRPAELDMSTFVNALLVGLGFAVFHEIGQFVHQLGHALAARATGYPMTGVRYEWGFSYSEYPSNEPPLPDNVHIQRSLGGVGGVTVLLVIAVVLWLQVDVSANAFTRWLLGFVLFDSLLLFIASAILSDGVLFIRNKDWQVAEIRIGRWPSGIHKYGLTNVVLV